MRRLNRNLILYFNVKKVKVIGTEKQNYISYQRISFIRVIVKSITYFLSMNDANMDYSNTEYKSECVISATNSLVLTRIGHCLFDTKWSTINSTQYCKIVIPVQHGTGIRYLNNFINISHAQKLIVQKCSHLAYTTYEGDKNK
jgi:hypothetical protein